MNGSRTKPAKFQFGLFTRYGAKSTWVFFLLKHSVVRGAKSENHILLGLFLYPIFVALAPIAIICAHFGDRP